MNFTALVLCIRIEVAYQIAAQTGLLPSRRGFNTFYRILCHSVDEEALPDFRR